MLKRLYISNFALIREMDVEFPGGLTVITGETGAGKSIFLEALGLVLGKRAEQGTLHDRSRKCVVEAEFLIEDLDLEVVLTEHEIDASSTLIIRREIGPEGKSRSFVNDGVIGVTALKALAERLVDIHSQHQTLLLNQTSFQVTLLDIFADNAPLLKSYKSHFFQLQLYLRELKKLTDLEADSRKELDYLRFQLNELEEISLKDGILNALEEESSALEHADTISNTLQRISAGLQDADDNLLIRLNAYRSELQGLSKFSSKYQQLAETINSIFIEAKELANEIDRLARGVELNPGRLAVVNEELDKLNRLLKKHGARDEKALLLLAEEMRIKLNNYESVEGNILALKKKISELEKQCNETAKLLSDRRKQRAPTLVKEVKNLLQELMLPNAELQVQVDQLTELNSNGMDDIRFLFSANKGVVLSDIQKVASGGELSRLMLVLKSIMANKRQLPTIIFDEIDTGVSGEVADRIGKILSRMGDRMQVVAITHLPQLASKGQHHLFVYKKDETEKTVSHIKQLSPEERVAEIAKMLSTGTPTKIALKNAQELLSVN